MTITPDMSFLDVLDMLEQEPTHTPSPAPAPAAEPELSDADRKAFEEYCRSELDPRD